MAGESLALPAASTGLIGSGLGLIGLHLALGELVGRLDGPETI